MASPPPSRPRSRPRSFHLALALLLVVSPSSVQALDARWAHSMVLLSSPASLLISSGKTTSPDGQTYTSSPTSSTFVVVPLTESFSLSSSSQLSSTSTPAITQSDSGAAPPYAWANMEALSNGDVWSFGGDGSPVTAVQTGEDSLWTRPSHGGQFTQREAESAGQPMRRVGAASCTMGDVTYLTGGMRGDGSNLGFLTTYSYSSATSSFTLLPSTLPLDLVQPSLHCLPNNSLLLLGGYSYTTSSLPSLRTAYTLDTSKADAEWVTITLGGNAAPEGRRAHLATTLGSGNGVFVHGGAKGPSGLGEVLDDAWVLDLEAGAWVAVSPAGTGPGARMGHQGVAIGKSQVMFFGGYKTDSAADASLYLYDLGTNAYLDTFTPPDSSVSTSPSATAGSGSPSSAATVTPVLVTSIETATSLIPTLTIVHVDGVEETFYSASTYATEVVRTSGVTPTGAQTTGHTDPSETDAWNPATYTGILPGILTATTHRRTISKATSTGSSDEAPAGLPTTKKFAIALGSTVGLLALVAVAGGALIIRRRKSRGWEAGWAAGEKRGRGNGEGKGLVRGGDEDGEAGAWASSRPGKRMRLGAGLGAMAAGVLAAVGGGERARQARVDMLGDEDTRRFETYPPPRSPDLDENGDERERPRPGEHGGWAGMGIWNRSSSFVGSLVSNNVRRESSGASGAARDWSELDGGDLGAGGHGYRDMEEVSSLLAINGRGANGGESPLLDDPFSDHHDVQPSEPAAAVAAPLQPFLSTKLNTPRTPLPRSEKMTSFYPGTNFPITSLPPPDMSDSGHSHSSDSHPLSINTSNDHSSGTQHHPAHPIPPQPAADGYIYAAHHHIQRSESTGQGGWRKVLGLRSKSPPPLTSLPSVGLMGARLHNLRDPSTPPVLDALDEEWMTGFKGPFGAGHQQEQSVNSQRSARTATSEQIERLAQMDIVRRNRTASGSTTAPSFANTTPDLASDGKSFDFRRQDSSSSSLRESSLPDHEQEKNPFDDQPSSPGTPDLIAFTSPPLGSQPSNSWSKPKPNGPRLAPPMLSSPSTSFSPSTSSASGASVTYSPTLTLPAAARRSVKDTVAAFELATTQPLNVVNKHKKKQSASYVAVPRAKLGIANPDDR